MAFQLTINAGFSDAFSVILTIAGAVFFVYGAADTLRDFKEFFQLIIGRDPQKQKYDDQAKVLKESKAGGSVTPDTGPYKETTIPRLSRADFEQFKQEHLTGETLRELRSRKQEFLDTKRQLFLQPKFIATTGLVIVATLFTWRYSPVFAFIVLLVGGLSLFIVREWILTPLKNKYRDFFKKAVLQNVVTYFDENITYTPYHYLSMEKVNASMLFPLKATDATGEDYMTGKAGNMEFELSEIELAYMGSGFAQMPDGKDAYPENAEKRKQKSKKKNTMGELMFKGLVFIADFGRDFYCTTVMRPEKFEWMDPQDKEDRNELPYYDVEDRLELPEDDKALERVYLEDPQFEETYNVYSTDQINARMIFTTSMIRRIHDFKERWGENVFTAFRGSKVYIAVPLWEGIFEPPLDDTSEAVEEEYVKHLFDDLNNVFGIVDELSLNDRIWGS